MSLFDQIMIGPQPSPRRSLIFGVHGVGKCLSGNTILYDPNTGRPKRLKDMVIENSGDVTSLSIGGVFHTRTPSCYIKNPDAELFKVTTQSGRNIEATENHPFLTMDGWKPLKELIHNDRVGIIANHSKLFGKTKTDKSTLKILAYLLTDGNLNNSSITFCKNDDIVRADYEDAVQKAGCDFVEFINSKGVSHVRVRRGTRNGENNVLKFIRDIGLYGAKSKDKFIPDFIYGLNKDRLALFLNRMFTCDGSVEQNKISYSSTSIKMVKQLQHLLLRFGIVAVYRNKYLDDRLYGGEIAISGAEDMVRFVDSIGFYGEKAARAEMLRDYAAKVKKPGSTFYIRSGDVMFDRIDTIESIGVHPVYDLTVPIDHNFVANDFIVHNSSLASDSPNPIFIQTEEGLDDINCSKFPIAESFDMVMAAIEELCTKKHQFKSLVIDSLDWLENLIWKQVCKDKNVDNIDDIGFAKGYSYATKYWRDLLEALSFIRKEKGMHIILLAHTKIERFANPETESYDRYVPNLQRLASAIIQEWCDEVLFATYTVHTKQKEEGFNRKRTQPIGTGERVLRTEERPAYLAKNRLKLPDEIPLSWNEYEKYFTLNQGA